MRKGTKSIRRVCTGSQEYYVYDLDEDAFGKCKRLYAKTEGELKEKIEAAEQERKRLVLAYKPKTKKLSDYVLYYFKNAVGSVSSTNIKKQIKLFENAVFGGSFDRDIDTITKEDIQEFYNNLSEKFPAQSVKDIDTVLQKTFELSNMEGITEIDFQGIVVPEGNGSSSKVSYILDPNEFENLLSFCIDDNCTRYGRNELIIVFSMLTGLKISSLKKLTSENIDLETKTVYCERRTIPLSERAVSWLVSQAKAGNVPVSVPEEMIDEEGTGISRYTCKGDEVLFTNSNNASPTMQSVQSTLTSIANRCGLPKGITGKTLCKSYVVSELSNGTSAEDLCNRLGYKTQLSIKEIQDEYEVRKLLF